MGTAYKKLNVAVIKRIYKKTSILWNAEYKITFNSQNSIGSWTHSSCLAYYGDIIAISTSNSERTRTITCYKWDSPAEPRWSNTITWPKNDAQYTYANFSVYLPGSVMVEKDMTITAFCTRTLNSYTITWKYLSAYPDTWKTETQTYNYGDTPSRTSPSTVTSDNKRKIFTSWDSLATVTGARTITANYKTQVNATFQGTRCYATINDSAASNGWYDAGTKVTWTANPNYAFSSNGSATTRTNTISTKRTKYTASADYVNVTKLTGTNCSTTATAGWKSINDTITWTADIAYAFDTSNTTSKSVAVVPGENKYTASYVKRYTLTISVTNASYGTYSVSRTKSPYQKASTGALSNGATIYYGDVLTGTSSAKAVSYDGWSVTNVTAPTFTTTGDAASGNLTVTNKSSYSATLYYNTSNAVGGTSAGTVEASKSKTVSGLSFNTQYYISVRVARTRIKHTYATDGTQYSGTNSVTGNVIATFKFKDTTSTDQGTIDSSVVAAKTAAQNQYSVTIAASEGINSVFLSTNPDALSGSPSGTTFKSTTTVYAFAAVHYNYVSRVPSSWTNVGTSGTSTVYRVGSVYISTSAYDFGTITLPALVTVTCSSSLIGLQSVYLSTSSTATFGSSSIGVTPGTAVYGFAVLGSDVATSEIKSSWTLISGTACKQGAIYKVGSKRPTSAGTTTMFNIELFGSNLSDVTVLFKRSGESEGSWNIINHVMQVGTQSNWVRFSKSYNSIYCDYIDYGDKDITDELLATFTCPAGYTFTLTLKDSDGNSVTWDDVDDPVNGPYTIDAYTEEDTTTT